MLTYSQIKLYSSLWQQVLAAKEKSKAPLNKPFRTPGGPKKFAVYVKNESGSVVIVRFGDPNMEIKRDDPNRRKNFRARHNCDNPGPKTKARYWSCKMWERRKSVKDYLKGSSEEWDGETFWDHEELVKLDASLLDAKEVIEDECDCGCGGCCDEDESLAARPGPKSSAQTPAKPEERRSGSNKNKPGSAGKSSEKSIEFSAKVVEALKSKVKEHNSKHSKKVSLTQLKKVYRRGAGAFSTSHRPGKTRGQWAMARVNMFLKMMAGGKVKQSYRAADSDVAKAFYLIEAEVEPDDQALSLALEDLTTYGLQSYEDFTEEDLYFYEEERACINQRISLLL